jgi:hypoxanthine phosphoribosyltransferase
MMHEDLERVLIGKDQIELRVEELAREIERDYAERDLVLVCILKGGIIFLSDLTRRIRIPHTYDTVGAMSYGQMTHSSGHVIITKDINVDIRGKDVLLIEDIYDTGRTMRVVKDLLAVHSPRSVEICAFIYKEKKHEFELPVKYIGFRIPDVFVVGYGLDYAERYRNLDCIGVLRKNIYSSE